MGYTIDNDSNEAIRYLLDRELVAVNRYGLGVINLAKLGSTLLSDQVYDHLRKAILLGKLTGGAEIKVHEVASELNISQSPVREGLRRLEQDGYVRLSPNRSAVVNRFGGRDMHDLHEMRSLVEPLAVKRFVLEASLSDIRHLDERVEKMQLGAERDDLFDVLENDMGFHAHICEFGGKVIARMWKAMDGPLRLFFYHMRPNYMGALEDIASSHIDMLKAISRRDAVRAVQLTREHLDLNLQAIQTELDEREQASSGEVSTTSA